MKRILLLLLCCFSVITHGFCQLTSSPQHSPLPSTGHQRNLSDTVAGRAIIRCLGSKAVTTPLVIIDGKVYEGTLDSIDPATIGQIIVLKDTTAMALYGTRAANGVIIIHSSLKKPHSRRQ
ncbi:TonB-dependent receptor plug domain-containing protein [Chitinophaga sp. G-6-1-13]|uniref:TonB-dependent receptor plug domain-containing protein n=1 Tax=Chitinophaga fulva TaxID=2728842 RepID=A0A848GV67_9BACT|nr:TonB-dependent receptor plug domain-containing protein [Chitinophaga fulva]NML40540.1 TonB-dependent receptor plug domain-containing protein [Chitinophaga fulva]